MELQILAYQISKEDPLNLNLLLQRSSDLPSNVKQEALASQHTYVVDYDSRDEPDAYTPYTKPLAEFFTDYAVVIQSYEPPESVLVLVRSREDWARFVEFCARNPLLNANGEGPLLGSFQKDVTPRKNPLRKSIVNEIAQALHIDSFSAVSPSTHDNATVLISENWFDALDDYHTIARCKKSEAWIKWESAASIESLRIEQLLHTNFPRLNFSVLIEEDGELRIRVQG